MPLIHHTVPGIPGLSLSKTNPDVRVGLWVGLVFLHSEPWRLVRRWEEPQHPATRDIEIGRVVCGKIVKVTSRTVHVALESKIIPGWVPENREIVIINRESHTVYSGLDFCRDKQVYPILCERPGHREAIGEFIQSELRAGAVVLDRLEQNWALRRSAAAVVGLEGQLTNCTSGDPEAVKAAQDKALEALSAAKSALRAVLAATKKPS